MSNRLENEFSDGETLTAADLNDTFDATTPIGSIVAWHKSFTNTPTLPAGWAECNGQTLSNPDSPYDGQTLPDLNGNNRFLRGNGTSGGTGGADSVALSVSELASHRHSYTSVAETNGNLEIDIESGGEVNYTNRNTDYTGGDSAHENRPPYFDVVYIMRVA